MKINCNDLELRLVTPSVSYHSSDDMAGGAGEEEQQQQQQLTIFYNGRVATCDVTELQARAIIMLARRQLEEKHYTTPVVPASATALSMKRSLQRFLQKRKTRAQSTSPYTATN